MRQGQNDRGRETQSRESSSSSSLEGSSSQGLPVCRQGHPQHYYYCPTARYCAWEGLDGRSKLYLQRLLHYRQGTWNYEQGLFHPLETTSFSDLESSMVSALQHAFGSHYDEDRHDCCFGHYVSYSWHELAAPARNAWERVGYTQSVWDGNGNGNDDGSVEASEWEWDALPKPTRVALREHLCYTRETWNQVPLPEWPPGARMPGSYAMEETDEESDDETHDDYDNDEDAMETTLVDTNVDVEVNVDVTVDVTNWVPLQEMDNDNVVVDPTSSPTALNPWSVGLTDCRPVPSTLSHQSCPAERYCAWDHFDFNHQQFLRYLLGYSEREWNYQADRSNELETMAWEDLVEYQQQAMEQMGFDERTHECCLGHYTHWEWSDLDAPQRDAWEAVGYTARSWNATNDDGEGEVTYEDEYWTDLPRRVQHLAATYLCYNQQLWDGVDLTDWPDQVILPGTVMDATLSEESLSQAQASNLVQSSFSPVVLSVTWSNHMIALVGVCLSFFLHY